MSKGLTKKAIGAAQRAFDSAALKTVTSPIKNYVSSYIELTRTEDYSGVKRIVDKYMEFAEKHDLSHKLRPKDPVAFADKFSRAVGGMDSIQAFGAILRHSKTIIAVSTVGLVAFSSPETTQKIMDWVHDSGLGAVSAVVSVAAVLITARFAYKSYEIHGMHKDAKFAENSQKDGSSLLKKGLEKLGKALDNESYKKASDAWVTKQCAKHEKKYKPDFSPDAVELITQGLAQQQSEAVLVSPFTPEQQKAIKKLSRFLRDEYFVPDHLATMASLTLLAESSGNSKAVAAMLNSRRIEQSVIDRFGIDPLATYGGKRQEPVKPVTQLPAPTPADVDSSPSP